MKVSIHWLKDFIDIGSKNAHEIADKLTMSGLEIETVDVLEKAENVVAAKVLTCGKHPDADKLSLCTVTDGSEEFQVVCGAPNVREGLTVAFARVGGKLPGGMKLKKAKIRGTESFGMICSASELGMEDGASDGIIELPDDVSLGADINDVLNLGDAVLTIGITPNRADCLSVLGVAREVAALFELPVKEPAGGITEDGGSASDHAYVKVEDTKKCPAYLGRVITGVKIAPSPLWMQNRLRSVGLRPINNVVDVTNYVMHTFGQPLHTFDLRTISGGIIVRPAGAGEKITTLDEKERTLDESMLVIADEKKPLAIAGVMGGENTGIMDDTTDVLLECAYFEPTSTRMTARKLGMQTDSSYRYERGIDPAGTEIMVDVAAALIRDVAGGSVKTGILTNPHEAPVRKNVVASVFGINALLGTSVSQETMISILKRLRFEVASAGDVMNVRVPTDRVDIFGNVDIAEEVLRVYGYDRVEPTLPDVETGFKGMKPKQHNERQIRCALKALGFSEVINYSFMSGDILEHYDAPEKFVHLMNPISEDMGTLRTMVTPGLVESLRLNNSMGHRQVKMFELANTFIKSDEHRLPTQTMHLSIGFIGGAWPLSWAAGQQCPSDPFFVLKGTVEHILAMLGLKADFVRAERSFLHPGKSAEIMVDGASFGFVGQLHPALAEARDLRDEAYIAELDIECLIEKAGQDLPQYAPFSKFPRVTKDISVIAGGDDAGAMVDSIRSASNLVDDAVLYDVYTGKGIEEGKRSLTFRITFSHPERTLTDEETNKVVSSIIATLGTEFGAKLR